MCHTCRGNLTLSLKSHAINIIFYVVLAYSGLYDSRYDYIMGLRPYCKAPTNCLKACVEVQNFLTLFIGVLLRFAAKLNLRGGLLDVEGYEWLVVVSFVVLVLGVLVVFTLLTIRESRSARKVRETVDVGSFSTLEQLREFSE